MRRAALLLVLLLSAPAAMAADPPKQLAKGPGGTEYQVAVGDIVKRRYGKGVAEAYVFRPASGEKRPVIVFMHAYDAMSPRHYGAWIEHLVRKGYVVIYPRYQIASWMKRSEITPNAEAGVKSALEGLEREAPGMVDLTRVAYVGHAAGGVAATNMAARAAAQGLPKARLVFAVSPGNSWLSGRLGTPLEDLSGLDPQTLIVTMVAERDNIARDTDGRKILRQATAVPASHKMLVKIFSDEHGRPILLANHNAPAALNEAYEAAGIESGDVAPPPPPPPEPTRPGQRPRPPRPAPPPPPPPVRNDNEPDFGGAVVDALDYYGYWKILDMALAAAFAGQDTSAIKTDPALPNMGQWSDGWPVKRMTFESARENPPPGAEPKAQDKPATPAHPTQRRRPGQR